MVRVLPRDGATVVDGSATAIADLAAFGALRTDRALHYAADLDEAALRAQAARGASFVISDSNRRRVFVAARLRGNTGWTVPAGGSPRDAAQLSQFRAARTDAQTVALVGGGVASVRQASPGFARLPSAPRFAALDGDGDGVAGRRARWPVTSRRGLRGAARRVVLGASAATVRVAWTAWRSTGASSPCVTGGTGCHRSARRARAGRARAPLSSSRRPARAGQAASRAAHSRRAGDRGAASAAAHRACVYERDRGARG
jgi:hypothetical protein